MLRSVFDSHRFGLLLVALGAAACAGETRVDDGPMGSGGNDGETDAGGSGNSGDGGSEASAGAGGSSDSGSGGTSYLTEDYCFDPEEAEACESEGWYDEGPFLFYEATTFDPDAKFVSLGGTSALLEVPGEGDTGAYRVVTAQETFEDEHVRVDEVIWPDAVGGFEVRYVWSGHVSVDHADLGLGTVNALACDDETCRIFTSKNGEDGLTAVSGSELPIDTQRLALDGLPCAFGQAAHCWDGQGFSEVLSVPSGTGDHFTEFFLRPEYEGFARRGLAVTDAGAVFLTDAAGDFQVVVPADSEWGLVVDAEYTAWKFSILFESGAWWLGAFDGSTEPPTDIACFEPDEMQFLGMGSNMLAVDHAGARYIRQWLYLDEPEPQYRFCASQSAPVPELLDVSEYECGLATNLFGITEQQFLGLTGPVQCPVG